MLSGLKTLVTREPCPTRDKNSLSDVLRVLESYTSYSDNITLSVLTFLVSSMLSTSTVTIKCIVYRVSNLVQLLIHQNLSVIKSQRSCLGTG